MPNLTMTKEPNLDAAYALRTPDDSRKLYAAWADSYDTDFAMSHGYQLHNHVARHYAEVGIGPVLDIGAGTGLCGQALAALGMGPVDGTDISPEMLIVAEGKGIYRRLFEGDVLAGLPASDGQYAGCVSSGTFTNGHVGPAGLDTIMRVTQPGGWIAISINSEHYKSQGFAEKFAGLEPHITQLTLTPVPIYQASEGAHASDTAMLARWQKR